MKRICCIISLFVLCLTFNQAHAQRCLPGMKGLQVTGGMADGVHWNSKSDFAYYFGAALSTYTKKREQVGCWRGIPRKALPLQGFANTSQPVYRRGRLLYELPFRPEENLFSFAGIVRTCRVRNEQLGDKLLPDGSTLTDKDGFVYGGALTLELETYLTDRVALLLSARERALFGSDIGKFHTQVSVGLKFIIN